MKNFFHYFFTELVPITIGLIFGFTPFLFFIMWLFGVFNPYWIFWVIFLGIFGWHEIWFNSADSYSMRAPGIKGVSFHFRKQSNSTPGGKDTTFMSRDDLPPYN